MEESGSRMPRGEMEGKEREVEEGEEEVAAEERKGEEREEKGRGGRGLRLFMCSLMTVRKRMKLLLRNREVSEGLEFYLMSRGFVPLRNCRSVFCAWVPLSC